jgi:hypothetical protein
MLWSRNYLFLMLHIGDFFSWLQLWSLTCAV